VLGIKVVEDAGGSSPEHIVGAMANEARKSMNNTEENRLP
jgi:hypothetical protein